MAYTTIDDPSAHFQVATYAGNSTNNTAITNDGNSNLQPDLIWAKSRTNSHYHDLRDTTRGIDERLASNDTGIEGTKDQSYVSFDSDGFTLGDDTDGSGSALNTVNTSSNSYVAWQWKANGGTRTTNTESGDNPAGGYQANTTAGFSIVDWTGTGGAGGLMAHGLGAVPHVIITKTRSHANAWAVYHHKNTSAPETDYLVLSSNAATVDNVNRWNDTAPTSTNLVLGDVGGVNSNDQTQIAYVFTEIQGYSKFGTYTGNNNANGPFIYLGFKPAFVMLKKTTGLGSHLIFDHKRPGYNGTGHRLYANDTDGEDTGTGDSIDILSNGFKVRGGSTSVNDDGETFVYTAFAEQPFVSSEGVPTTAR